MGRKARVNYISVALNVLRELGGGPISTKMLVDYAREEKMIGDGEWVYHNFSRKVRESDLFDTSVRGQVKLATSDVLSEVERAAERDGFVDEPVGPVGEVEEPAETETTVEQPFPGPTLGAGAPALKIALFDRDEILRRSETVKPKD